MVLLMLCPRAFLWALQGLARATDTAHSAPHNGRRQDNGKAGAALMTAGRAGDRGQTAGFQAAGRAANPAGQRGRR